VNERTLARSMSIIRACVCNLSAAPSIQVVSSFRKKRLMIEEVKKVEVHVRGQACFKRVSGSVFAFFRNDLIVGLACSEMP